MYINFVDFSSAYCGTNQEETEIEVEAEAGDAILLYSDMGVDTFHKHLMKKGFIEERGFRELVDPFNNEVESRGWEMVS